MQKEMLYSFEEEASHQKSENCTPPFQQILVKIYINGTWNNGVVQATFWNTLPNDICNFNKYEIICERPVNEAYMPTRPTILKPFIH